MSRDHVGLVYHDTVSLANGITEFLLTGLREGGAAVVVATPAHREAVERCLAARGLDLASARDRGALLSLDAEETTNQFLIDDLPEPAAFFSAIGSLIGRASRPGGPVHVYGEMVGVLWQAGHINAAIAVEGLWNELSGSLAFSLLCGYPAEALEEMSEAAVAFETVRALYSRTLGDAGRSVGPARTGFPAERSFAGSAASVGAARRFVAKGLQGSVRTDLLDDAVLVVSELAANAVRHASSAFTISVAISPDRAVRLAVNDDLPPPPPPGHRLEPVPGHGLGLVDVLANEWGCDAFGSGKRIWAELGPRPARLDTGGQRVPLDD